MPNKFAKAQISFDDEISADNFSGGGGASTGIEQAFGRPVTIAINHDPDAILMHKMNHPYTEHYQESVWDIDPVEVCRGRKVGLAWFSPDCKHFSKAKGGKPVDKSIRGLAWVALRWAATVRPRVLMLENVEEFLDWGPLIPKTDPATGRVLKVIEYGRKKGSKHGAPKIVVAEPGEVVPIEQCLLVPDPERKGETFECFIGALSTGVSKNHPAFNEMCDALTIDIDSDMANKLSHGLGYAVEHNMLRACDFGAPTIRKRFFLVARCDGRPIVWPKPTHGPVDSPEVKSGKLKPYRSAAECIDFSLPCPSIFDRKKPLAVNTQKRIARGLDKFVIKETKPFIVHIGNGERKGQLPRIQNIDKPLSTIVGSCKQYLGMPIMQTAHFDNMPNKITDPLTTITTANCHSIVTPYLANAKFDNAPNSVADPLTTITAVNNHSLIAPSLIQYHSETSANEVRGQRLDTPLMTVDAGSRYAIQIPYLSKFYGGVVGADIKSPLPTVTAVDHNALTLPYLSKFFGTGDNIANIKSPLPTVTAVDKTSLNLPFLTQYYKGDDHNADVRAPLNTITVQPRHFLTSVYVKKYSKGCCLGYWSEVRRMLNEYTDWNLADDEILIFNIYGVEYFIFDIGLRMLQPKELYLAQGFPVDYHYAFNYMGKAYTKKQQVAKCGNAVPPPFAEALVRANLPEKCVRIKINTMHELNDLIAV